jgi:aldose 1-epimerase
MQDFPTGAQYEIRSGDQVATVVELGGGLRAYQVGGRDVVDGYAETELPPAAHGQVLAPWPNRLRDGRYHWHGADYQVPLTEPRNGNAIHGLVSWLPWQGTPVDGSAVRMSCALPPTHGYPWRLELTTVWSVGPDGLRAEHGIVNRSDTAAPFGLGVHPYVAVPGTPVDDLVLTVPAHLRLRVDGRKLPIAVTATDGTEWDYAEGRRIGAAVLDTAFHGAPPAEGSAVVLTGGSSRVSVWADGGFPWWQVFTGDTLGPPRARRSVAVEPMTCPPDAFRSGRDLVTLEPGAAWHGAWGIRPELP